LSMAACVAIANGVRFRSFRATGEVLDLSRQTDIADVSQRLAGRVVSV